MYVRSFLLKYYQYLCKISMNRRNADSIGLLIYLYINTIA